MSDYEKQQRDRYQKKRMRWIRIQSVIAVLLAIVTAASLLIYGRLNRRTYVTYTEKGCISHTVTLEDNNFYDEAYLDQNHAYVAVLMDTVNAQFFYNMCMEDAFSQYQYGYTVDACVHITDKETGADVFDPVFTLKELQTGKVTDNTVAVKEQVTIDYHEYNELAKNFVEAYELKNVTATLVVTMNMELKGAGRSAAQESANTYKLQLNIPLLKQTVGITSTSTVPTGEQKILACDSPWKAASKYTALISGVLLALSLLGLTVYVLRTRDNHIDYARRVAKLLNNYKSYIQRITDPFCFDGYQVLHVATFPELLEIRDTLQIPVLMYENEDKTAAWFFVATASGVLYLYDVYVEGFEKQEAPQHAGI